MPLPARETVRNRYDPGQRHRFFPLLRPPTAPPASSTPTPIRHAVAHTDRVLVHNHRIAYRRVLPRVLLRVRWRVLRALTRAFAQAHAPSAGQPLRRPGQHRSHQQGPPPRNAPGSWPTGRNDRYLPPGTHPTRVTPTPCPGVHGPPRRDVGRKRVSRTG